MKKILIPALLAIAVGLALVVIPLAGRFSTIQFVKAMEMTTLVAQSADNGLTAQSETEKTNVLGGNISRVGRMLTVSEIKRAYFAGQQTASVVLTYSDGTVISLWQSADQTDETYFLVEKKGSRTVYSIQGYHTLDNVRKAVSAQGFSEPNDVLE